MHGIGLARSTPGRDMLWRERVGEGDWLQSCTFPPCSLGSEVTQKHFGFGPLAMVDDVPMYVSP